MSSKELQKQSTHIVNSNNNQIMEHKLSTSAAMPESLSSSLRFSEHSASLTSPPRYKSVEEKSYQNAHDLRGASDDSIRAKQSSEQTRVLDLKQIPIDARNNIINSNSSAHNTSNSKNADIHYYLQKATMSSSSLPPSLSTRHVEESLQSKSAWQQSHQIPEQATYMNSSTPNAKATNALAQDRRLQEQDHLVKEKLITRVGEGSMITNGSELSAKVNTSEHPDKMMDAELFSHVRSGVLRVLDQHEATNNKTVSSSRVSPSISRDGLPETHRGNASIDAKRESTGSYRQSDRRESVEGTGYFCNNESIAFDVMTENSIEFECETPHSVKDNSITVAREAGVHVAKEHTKDWLPSKEQSFTRQHNSERPSQELNSDYYDNSQSHRMTSRRPSSSWGLPVPYHMHQEMHQPRVIDSTTKTARVKRKPTKEIRTKRLLNFLSGNELKTNPFSYHEYLRSNNIDEDDREQFALRENLLRLRDAELTPEQRQWVRMEKERWHKWQLEKFGKGRAEIFSEEEEEKEKELASRQIAAKQEEVQQQGKQSMKIEQKESADSTSNLHKRTLSAKFNKLLGKIHCAPVGRSSAQEYEHYLNSSIATDSHRSSISAAQTESHQASVHSLSLSSKRVNPIPPELNNANSTRANEAATTTTNDKINNANTASKSEEIITKNKKKRTIAGEIVHYFHKRSQKKKDKKAEKARRKEMERASQQNSIVTDTVINEQSKSNLKNKEISAIATNSIAVSSANTASTAVEVKINEQAIPEALVNKSEAAKMEQAKQNVQNLEEATATSKLCAIANTDANAKGQQETEKKLVITTAVSEAVNQKAGEVQTELKLVKESAEKVMSTSQEQKGKETNEEKNIKESSNTNTHDEDILVDNNKKTNDNGEINKSITTVSRASVLPSHEQRQSQPTMTLKLDETNKAVDDVDDDDEDDFSFETDHVGKNANKQITDERNETSKDHTKSSTVKAVMEEQENKSKLKTHENDEGISKEDEQHKIHNKNIISKVEKRNNESSGSKVSTNEIAINTNIDDSNDDDRGNDKNIKHDATNKVSANAHTSCPLVTKSVKLENANSSYEEEEEQQQQEESENKEDEGYEEYEWEKSQQDQHEDDSHVHSDTWNESTEEKSNVGHTSDDVVDDPNTKREEMRPDNNSRTITNKQETNVPKEVEHSAKSEMEYKKINSKNTASSTVNARKESNKVKENKKMHLLAEAQLESSARDVQTTTSDNNSTQEDKLHEEQKEQQRQNVNNGKIYHDKTTRQMRTHFLKIGQKVEESLQKDKRYKLLQKHEESLQDELAQLNSKLEQVSALTPWLGEYYRKMSASEQSSNSTLEKKENNFNNNSNNKHVHTSRNGHTHRRSVEKVNSREKEEQYELDNVNTTLSLHDTNDKRSRKFTRAASTGQLSWSDTSLLQRMQRQQSKKNKRLAWEENKYYTKQFANGKEHQEMLPDGKTVQMSLHNQKKDNINVNCMPADFTPLQQTRKHKRRNIKKLTMEEIHHLMHKMYYFNNAELAKVTDSRRESWTSELLSALKLSNKEKSTTPKHNLQSAAHETKSHYCNDVCTGDNASKRKNKINGRTESLLNDIDEYKIRPSCAACVPQSVTELTALAAYMTLTERLKELEYEQEENEEEMTEYKKVNEEEHEESEHLLQSKQNKQGVTTLHNGAPSSYNNIYKADKNISLYADNIKKVETKRFNEKEKASKSSKSRNGNEHHNEDNAYQQLIQSMLEMGQSLQSQSPTTETETTLSEIENQRALLTEVAKSNTLLSHSPIQLTQHIREEFYEPKPTKRKPKEPLANREQRKQEEEVKEVSQSATDTLLAQEERESKQASMSRSLSSSTWSTSSSLIARELRLKAIEMLEQLISENNTSNLPHTILPTDKHMEIYAQDTFEDNDRNGDDVDRNGDVDDRNEDDDICKGINNLENGNEYQFEERLVEETEGGHVGNTINSNGISSGVKMNQTNHESNATDILDELFSNANIEANNNNDSNTDDNSDTDECATLKFSEATSR